MTVSLEGTYYSGFIVTDISLFKKGLRVDEPG